MLKVIFSKQSSIFSIKKHDRFELLVSISMVQISYKLFQILTNTVATLYKLVCWISKVWKQVFKIAIVMEKMKKVEKRFVLHRPFNSIKFSSVEDKIYIDIYLYFISVRQNMTSIYNKFYHFIT